MTPDVLRCTKCSTPVADSDYIIVGARRVPVCAEHLEQLKREVLNHLETDITQRDFLDWPEASHA